MIVRTLVASFVAVVVSVSASAEAQQGRTEIVESPDGTISVVLPDAQTVTLESSVVIAFQGLPTADGRASQAGLASVNAAPGAGSDQPLDPGTSQPTPRELIGLDQEIDRVLAVEGTGDAGPAGDGGDPDGAGGPTAAEGYDETVFDVRGNETLSPDGN